MKGISILGATTVATLLLAGCSVNPKEVDKKESDKQEVVQNETDADKEETGIVEDVEEEEGKNDLTDELADELKKEQEYVVTLEELMSNYNTAIQDFDKSVQELMESKNGVSTEWFVNIGEVHRTIREISQTFSTLMDNGKVPDKFKQSHDVFGISTAQMSNAISKYIDGVDSMDSSVILEATTDVQISNELYKKALEQHTSVTGQ